MSNIHQTESKNITTIKSSEFPTLGASFPKKKVQTKINSNNMANFNKINSPTNDPNEYRCGLMRTTSFNIMGNKDKIAQTLKCTKGCRNVTTLDSEGHFGVCYRQHCTFAHSMEELTPPPCSFGSNCRMKYGSRPCRFRHDDETVEEWITRSGVTRPNLPPTNKDSRKPQESSYKNNINNIKNGIPKKTSLLGIGVLSKAPAHRPKQRMCLSPVAENKHKDLSLNSLSGGGSKSHIIRVSEKTKKGHVYDAVEAILDCWSWNENKIFEIKIVSE
jgi:hypothetical protein